jgi:flagellar basal body-associated protein FliL
MNKESIIIYLILLIALIVFGVSIYNTTLSASKIATERVPSKVQVSL